MTISAYAGKIHNGKVEFGSLIDLADGSEVVVVPTSVTERIARRTANGFLVGNVGNMLMARDGRLIQTDFDWIWRFGVFITALAHEPRGPIEHVDISATTSAVIDEHQTKTRLLERGRNNFLHTLLDDDSVDDLIAQHPSFAASIRCARQQKTAGKVRRLSELRARYVVDEPEITAE